VIVLFVQLAAWLLLRLLGQFDVPGLRSWRSSGRVSTRVLFFFTGTAHFTPLKHDLLAMIPPPLPREMWVVYLTGLLEIAGAIGLLVARLGRSAGICLILFLIAVLPANIYAAINDVQLRGEPATPLIIRIPMQLFWIVILWCTSVRSSGSSDGHSGQVVV
jgi:uncharacterized membrane protein